MQKTALEKSRAVLSISAQLGEDSMFNTKFREPNQYLNNSHGWKMHDSEIKQAMGFRSADKWPSEGVEPRMVGNVKVWVLGKKEAREFRFKHRAFAECPHCFKAYTAGKIHQHFPACMNPLS